MTTSSRGIARRELSESSDQAPHVEVLTRPPGPATVATPLRHSTRFRVFAVTFLTILVAGSVWNFTRPAIYRATATVLVEVPEGIGFAAGEDGTDTQNVAVQERILLARDLLEEALQTAARNGAQIGTLDVDALGRMLSVLPTPETNLVELTAVGREPVLLADLVNAWIDAYLARRQRQVQTDVDSTLSKLQEEYARLEATKRERAAALDAYRTENDIDTMESQGNQALARLASLTAELNKAQAEETKAQADREALEQAIGRGEPVVPPEEQSGLDQMRADAAKLRSHLAVIQKRYTRVYLENEPSLREVPAQLAELETRIAKKIAEGREFLRSKLTREIERARRQRTTIEQQLAVARSEASRFTARYSRYETMKRDLEKLDEMHRDLQARLAEVKAKAPAQYAQVKVVESAFPPKRPFEPEYGRDFLLTAAGAFGTALVGVLLVEVLGRRPREPDEMLPVTGVRVFAPAASESSLPRDLLAADRSNEMLASPLRSEAAQALPSAILRELLVAEVRALIELSDPATKELIGFLLCGLAPQECAELEETHFLLDDDSGQNVLEAPGDGRKLPIPPGLSAVLRAHRPIPLWSGASGSAAFDNLSARIGLLAHDAGLAHSSEIGVDALRHTYLCFLARQGARLTELERVVGTIPANELARYSVYKPAGPGRPLAELELCYPALAA